MVRSREQCNHLDPPNEEFYIVGSIQQENFGPWIAPRLPLFRRLSRGHALLSYKLSSFPQQDPPYTSFSHHHRLCSTSMFKVHQPMFEMSVSNEEGNMELDEL